ncbi:MAG TPA: malate synthase G, partial [Acetobacteraceae bacterium]
MDQVTAGELKVATVLKDFVDNEAIPGTGLEAAEFWASLSRVVALFAPRNAELLAVRDRMQAQLDEWHRSRRGQPIDPVAYDEFLRGIGYRLPEPEAFSVSTSGVDPEI